MAVENKKESGTIIIIKKKRDEETKTPETQKQTTAEQEEIKRKPDFKRKSIEHPKAYKTYQQDRTDQQKEIQRPTKFDRKPSFRERYEELRKTEKREEIKKEEEKKEEEIRIKEEEKRIVEETEKKVDVEKKLEQTESTLPEQVKESEEKKEQEGSSEGVKFGDVEIFSGREDIIPFRAKRFFSYKKKKKKKFQKAEEYEEEVKKEEKTEPKKIKISGIIRVADLSKITGIKSSEIIKKLLEIGKEVTINHFITSEEAELVCLDYGIEVEREEFDETKFFDTSTDSEDSLKKRPPVVVVMGHVDHGKTTLLDSIRKTNIAETEFGGITQSIGAYTVEINQQTITFIDTPGHEAFTEMRTRGAKVADIAVLVVAADEGVKPQTEEAISHAKAAELPIIVAINKIDKPGANPDFVKNQLAQLGLIPDDWGGDVLYANISAKKKIGIDELLEKILLQAEILNLRANPSRLAEGVIIESSIDKGLGATATVIVQRGTLKKGDVFVAGLMWGRVRNIFSDKGNVLKEVPPGFPAKIVIGGEQIPYAGDKIYVVKDEEIAAKIVEERKLREGKKTQQSISLEQIFEKIKEGSQDKVVLPLILKSSSAGSLDALEKEITAIKHPNAEIKIILKGIGIVSQSDVNLAAASGGIIIGYGVGADKNAQNLAKMHKVQIRLYRIIYEIVDDIKKALQGMLKPKEREIVLGKAKILKIFKLSVGKVLGCFVESGKLIQGTNVRVKRDGEELGVGKIISLRRFKDTVQEITEGNECGLIIEGVQDAKENDIIECFRIEKEEISIA